MQHIDLVSSIELATLEVIERAEHSGSYKFIVKNRLFKILFIIALSTIIFFITFALQEKLIIDSKLPTAWSLAGSLAIALVGEHFLEAPLRVFFDSYLLSPIKKQISKITYLGDELALRKDLRDTPDIIEKRLSDILRQPVGVFIRESNEFVQNKSSIPSDSSLICHIRGNASKRLIHCKATNNGQNFTIFPIGIGFDLHGFILVRLQQVKENDILEREQNALLQLCSQLAPIIKEICEHQENLRSIHWLSLAEHISQEIGAWIKSKQDILAREAKSVAMHRNDYASHQTAMRFIRSQIGPEFSGVYTLDSNGMVLTHFAPPTVHIEGHFNASARPYFISCRDTLKPVVGNVLDSADRNIPIFVIAVPRFDADEHFIGILDAVLDHPFHPVSEALQSACAEWHDKPKNKANRPDLVIYVFDDLKMLIATNQGPLDPKESLSGNQNVTDFLKGVSSKSKTYSNKLGAMCRVENTPFRVLVLEKSFNESKLSECAA